MTTVVKNQCETETLESRYSTDPELLEFYKKKLLVPGWAYIVDDVEADYIARELSKSPALRRLWQVAKFTRYRKKITPAIAKRLAQVWVENPPRAIEASVTDRLKTENHQNNGLIYSKREDDFPFPCDNQRRYPEKQKWGITPGR